MDGTSREGDASGASGELLPSLSPPELPEIPKETIGVVSYFRLLRRNRNFRLLWSAQVVSELGDWFYTLAIYSLLLDLTGKASSVALALVLQLLPQTLFTPTAGVVHHRQRRKIVMISPGLAPPRNAPSLPVVPPPPR